MGFRKRGERRHAASLDILGGSRGSAYRAQDILAEGEGVEFEVGFEEEIGGVVESPFAGIGERGSKMQRGGYYLPLLSCAEIEAHDLPIASAKAEDTIDLPRGIFEFLVSAVGVIGEHILFLLQAAES